MQRWLTHGVLLLATLLPATAAFAAIVNVGGGKNAFSPQTITINAGDTVIFVNKGGFHNVVADNDAFRCANGCDGDGKGGSGAASSGSWLAKVTFAKGGTFGYFCEVHGQPGAGMYGTVKVISAPPPPPPPPPAPPTDPIPMSGAALALLIGAILLSALIALYALRRRSRR